MIKLVWAFMVVTAQGPAVGTISETTKFDTREACQKFGTDMTPRVEDWVRGALRADWDHPVRIDFNCEPNGQPA